MIKFYVIYFYRCKIINWVFFFTKLSFQYIKLICKKTIINYMKVKNI